MKKRKPKYIRILEGMNCCYGGSDERKCSDCPYDKYNDRDFFGQGTSYCMERLNKDAKDWTENMTMFTNCGDCCCWHKDWDEEGKYHAEWEEKQGCCSVWNTVMHKDEFCSRGAYND